MYNKAIVTGSIAFDEIMDFPSSFTEYIHPEKIHKLNVSFVVNRLEKQIGGTATNITYNINLITKKKAYIAASIGKDGQIFIDWLRKNNLSSEHILTDKNTYTASGKVITDKDDNQIWGFYYGACEEAKKINIEKNLTDKTILVISANHPDAFLNFQNQAIKKNATYLYDPGMTLTWIKKDDLTSGIKHCTWLVGNDYEIGRILDITGLSLSQLIQDNKAVITTKGADGVQYLDRDNAININAYSKTKIVDPTGAGDAWRGAFLAGILQNMSIKDSLILSNALASFAVEKYGTVNHAPTKKQLDERIKTIRG